MNRLDRFIAWHREEGHSQQTCKTYRDELEQLGRQLKKPIEDATTFDLRNYMAEHVSLAPATRAKKIHAIRSFYGWLVDVEEYRPDNPAGKLHAPKLPEAPPKYLQHSEVMQLKDNITDPLMSVLVDVMYATGIRISEAVGLNQRDVLWQSNRIRVRGKGGKTREVPITSTALTSLRRYLDKRHDNNEALFLNKFGRRMSIRTVQLYFHKLGIESGIDRIDVTPHKMRHSWATTLRSQGVEIDDISRWAGHASIQTTMRYARVVDSKQMETYRQAVPEGM